MKSTNQQIIKPDFMNQLNLLSGKQIDYVLAFAFIVWSGFLFVLVSIPEFAGLIFKFRKPKRNQASLDF